MEESLREAPSADAWRESLSKTIDEQRCKVGERIAGQRERLRELESRMATQLEEVTQELTRQQDQCRQATTQAEAKTASLLERQARLDERQHQFDRRQAELDQARADLAGRNAAETERTEEFKRRESELAAARQAHDAEVKKLQAQLDAAKRLEGELKAKEQALVNREKDIQRQRRSVAQQLRSRKNDLAAERELQKAEAAASGAGQDLQLQLRLSELQGKYDRLREEVDAGQSKRDDATQKQAELKAQLEARQNEVRQHQAALDQAQRKQVELETERNRLQAEEGAWQKARQELERKLTAAQQAGGNNKESAAELAALRAENKSLEMRVTQAEEKAKRASTGGDQEMDDMRRRFEMAVQDVRELKTKNAELTEELAKAKQSGSGAAAGASQGGDWESRKQKLLAELDADFDENNESQKADKLTVQGAIKITDQVVAEKEHEIQELRRLLESQAQQVGEVAVGAAAVAQMLDTDELIRQERDSLKQLQEALREQLRQAEVDNSLERAKLARERAELDEKIRGIEVERANMPAGGDAAGDKGKKGGGRKWLARLGLGDAKEE